MTSTLRLLAFASLFTLLPGPTAAQPAPPAQHRNQVTLDATILGGSLGYARRTSGRRLVGGGIGVGGDFVGYMLLAGRHFAESSGPAYETRDGFTDKLLFEMLHLNAFVRHETTGRWTFDTGARASLFFHGDSSDDDLGAGIFLGGYAGAFYDVGPLSLGPRLLVGGFSEGRPEFGIFVAPITIRLSLRR